MREMIRCCIALMLFLTALATWSCGDSSAPDNGSRAASYTATTLRVTPSGQPAVDVLASGGSLSLTIEAQNQVTGHLSIPPSIQGGLEADMAGTAVVNGNTVTFDQTADTFIRDLTFTRVGSELHADQTLSGTRFEVILSPQ